MSYEHCHEHDEDATNGCSKCRARELQQEAQRECDEFMKNVQVEDPKMREALAFGFMAGYVNTRS